MTEVSKTLVVLITIRAVGPVDQVDRFFDGRADRFTRTAHARPIRSSNPGRTQENVTVSKVSVEVIAP